MDMEDSAEASAVPPTETLATAESPAAAEEPSKEDCEEVLAGSGRDFDLVAAGDRADVQARDAEEIQRGWLYRQRARAGRGLEDLRCRADRRLDGLEAWLERRFQARCREAIDAELRWAARAAEILDTVEVGEFWLGPSTKTVESCERLCFEDDEVLGALVRYQLKQASTLSQVLLGRAWREVLPRCLCQITVACLVGLAVFCILAAIAFAPTRSLSFGSAGEVAAPPASMAAAASAIALRPLWQFPELSLQELRQVDNVVFEEGQLRHSLRVAVTWKTPDGGVTLQSTDSSLRVDGSGRGFWLRGHEEVPLEDMEMLRQLPGADTHLAWMGAQLATEVVMPA